MKCEANDDVGGGLPGNVLVGGRFGSTEAERSGGAKIERDMRKRANTERQQQIQRDTDRLLQLATELKQAVDKSNENTLSLDVIKKAEEVERLAHSVKEKMRGNY